MRTAWFASNHVMREADVQAGGTLERSAATNQKIKSFARFTVAGRKPDRRQREEPARACVEMACARDLQL